MQSSESVSSVNFYSSASNLQPSALRLWTLADRLIVDRQRTTLALGVWMLTPRLLGRTPSLQKAFFSLQASCQRRSVCAGAMSEPANPGKVKVALCQLHVTADKEQNIATARAAIQEASSNGAKLVVLPEMWNCPYSNDSFSTYAEDIDNGLSPSTQMLSEAAEQYAITLVGGSVPERSDGKLYNTCCVYDHQGKLLGKHRKVHLFDIDIPGKMTFKESLTLTPGESITVVDTAVGRLGIGICYDIRFPELAMLYRQRGAQALIYPGAFNTVTGPLHWELLARGRAVDNQCFVITCSPARNPDASYQAWGHSTVVGPFAEVLATTEHEPAIIYADLEFDQVEERRTNLPLKQQKRHDLYDLVDKSL